MTLNVFGAYHLMKTTNAVQMTQNSAAKFYKLLERVKDHDLKEIIVKKGNHQHPKHSCQSTATDETTIKLPLPYQN